MMLKYDTEEATLIAWKLKLEEIETDRQELKLELLTLLNAESERQKEEKQSANDLNTELAQLRTELDQLKKGLAITNLTNTEVEDIDRFAKMLKEFIDLKIGRKELEKEINSITNILDKLTDTLNKQNQQLSTNLALDNKQRKTRQQWIEESILRIEKSIQLANELQKAIDSKRLAASRLDSFNQRKATLLSSDHGQGWTWSAHFNWLWNLISFIIPIKNYQPGSKLRQALTETPIIQKQELSLTNPSENSPSLSDEVFENALFENPEKAYNALLSDIKNLKEDSPKEKIMMVLERLNAIKLRLPEETYKTHLADLFGRFPNESLRFYYDLYHEAQPEMPEPHEFIEHHLMASTLMDKFILSHKTHPRFFATHTLLILLSRLESDDDPISTLISRGSNINSLNALDEIYTGNELNQDSLKEILKKEFKERMSEDTYKKRNTTNEYGLTSFDNPLNVAQDIFSYLKPNKHPLLMQVARLACEEFLRECYNRQQEDKDWQQGHLGYSTIYFITEQILGTWRHTKVDDKGRVEVKETSLKKQEDCIDLLNPFTKSIASNYQHAEKYIAEILIHINSPFTALNATLDAARKIRSQYQKDLHEFELSWILFRIGHIQPELVKALDHILSKTVFYSVDELASLDNSISIKTKANSIKINDLIENIQINLEKAAKARNVFATQDKNTAVRPAMEFFGLVLGNNDNELTSEQPKQLLQNENIAVRQAIESFCLVLRNNDNELTSEQLDILFKQLLEFKHYYLTKDAFQQWYEKIETLQTTLTCWEEKDLAEVSLGEVKSHPLDATQKNYQEAKQAKATMYSSNFAQEQKHAKLAVCYFALFMKQPTKDRLSEAYQLLDNLKPYLTETQHNKWYSQLKKEQAREQTATKAVESPQTLFYTDRTTDTANKTTNLSQVSTPENKSGTPETTSYH